MPPATGSAAQNVAVAKGRLALVWRLLIYLVLFIATNLVANTARVGLESLGAPRVVARFFFTFVYVGGVLGLTYVYRRRVDRRSWEAVGLPRLGARGPDVARGAAFGFILVALMFAIQIAARWIHVTGLESGASAFVVLVDSLLLSLAFGVCEEIAFRGYVFRNIAEQRPIWQATLITGLIFGAFHAMSTGLGPRGLSFFIFIMVLNTFLVFTLLITRSLWMAIGLHVAFDWAAINFGLGSVVLADRPLLHVERTVSLVVEDLIGVFLVGLGIAFLLSRAWGSNRGIAWRASPGESYAQSGEGKSC
jgi:membrane protease YdiL (CAAX protease family)